jgi:hypothetical protein
MLSKFNVKSNINSEIDQIKDSKSDLISAISSKTKINNFNNLDTNNFNNLDTNNFNNLDTNNFNNLDTNNFNNFDTNNFNNLDTNNFNNLDTNNFNNLDTNNFNNLDTNNENNQIKDSALETYNITNLNSLDKNKLIITKFDDKTLSKKTLDEIKEIAKKYKISLSIKGKPKLKNILIKEILEKI